MTRTAAAVLVCLVCASQIPANLCCDNGGAGECDFVNGTCSGWTLDNFTAGCDPHNRCVQLSSQQGRLLTGSLACTPKTGACITFYYLLTNASETGLSVSLWYAGSPSAEPPMWTNYSDSEHWQYVKVSLVLTSNQTYKVVFQANSSHANASSTVQLDSIHHYESNSCSILPHYKDTLVANISVSENITTPGTPTKTMTTIPLTSTAGGSVSTGSSSRSTETSTETTPPTTTTRRATTTANAKSTTSSSRATDTTTTTTATATTTDAISDTLTTPTPETTTTRSVILTTTPKTTTADPVSATWSSRATETTTNLTATSADAISATSTTSTPETTTQTRPVILTTTPKTTTTDPVSATWSSRVTETTTNLTASTADAISAISTTPAPETTTITSPGTTPTTSKTTAAEAISTTWSSRATETTTYLKTTTDDVTLTASTTRLTDDTTNAIPKEKTTLLKTTAPLPMPKITIPMAKTTTFRATTKAADTLSTGVTKRMTTGTTSVYGENEPVTSSNTVAIIAGVSTPVVVVIFIVVLLLIRRKHRQKMEDVEMTATHSRENPQNANWLVKTPSSQQNDTNHSTDRNTLSTNKTPSSSAKPVPRSSGVPLHQPRRAAGSWQDSVMQFAKSDVTQQSSNKHRLNGDASATSNTRSVSADPIMRASGVRLHKPGRLYPTTGLWQDRMMPFAKPEVTNQKSSNYPLHRDTFSTKKDLTTSIEPLRAPPGRPYQTTGLWQERMMPFAKPEVTQQKPSNYPLRRDTFSTNNAITTSTEPFKVPPGRPYQTTGLWQERMMPFAKPEVTQQNSSNYPFHRDTFSTNDAVRTSAKPFLRVSGVPPGRPYATDGSWQEKMMQLTDPKVMQARRYATRIPGFIRTDPGHGPVGRDARGVPAGSAHDVYAQRRSPRTESSQNLRQHERGDV